MITEGRIDRAGFLWVKRPRHDGARWERAGCPNGPKTTCGDHCALFGGPSPGEGDSLATTSIDLCHKKLNFLIFVDKRYETK